MCMSGQGDGDSIAACAAVLGQITTIITGHVYYCLDQHVGTIHAPSWYQSAVGHLLDYMIAGMSAYIQEVKCKSCGESRFGLCT